MARMIPPVISPDTRSPGEREIFQRLRDDPDTHDWIVLHSLDVAAHRRQVVGEIDFGVIVPGKGVLCLEVKAHTRIRCEDGLWYFGAATTPEARSRGPYRRPARHASVSPITAAAVMATSTGARRSVPAYARKPTRSRVASPGISSPTITAVSAATIAAAAR